MKIDYLGAIDKYLDGVEAGIQEVFPIESNRHKLSLESIEVDRDKAKDAAQDLKAQVEAKLTDSSITIPVYGTLILTDKESGKVIDKKRRKLLDAPVMTKRLTFMVQGGDYNILKQFRLKPGIYTRKKENGDVESFFNMSKGGKVKVAINLNPENNSFSIGLGNANPRLYPVLKALGVSDREMLKAWGKDLFLKNKSNDKDFQQNIKKAYKAVMKSDAKADATESEMIQGIKDFFANTGMSPDTTKITLGKGFDSVTPEALVTTSHKLLKVSRGEEKPDARDSLFFKQIFDVDELIKARIKAFKYEISKKVKNNLDKKDKIADIFSKDFISKPVHSFITQSGLSTISEAVNPVSMFNAATKTTIMGEGGLGSLDAVTTPMRSVDSSHAGFLDPIHTPESNRIGINLNLAVGSDIKGKNLYTTVIDAKTKKPVKKTSGELMEEYVAFPDQYDIKTGKWNYPQIRCMHRSEIMEVPPSKITYIIPNAQAMFSISSNLMPFLANTQGNRGMMGNKMFGQAVPLTHREAPLVQVKFGKDSYENHLRKLYAVSAPVDGTVTKVTKDEIHIKDKNGKSHAMGLYNNFQLAGKSFIHNTPIVSKGDKVKKGDLLADDNFSKGNTMALGTNLNVAYMPFQDKTFEDGIPISESAAKKLTSEHLFQFKETVGDKDLSSIDTYKKQFPGIITPSMEGKLGNDGIIKEGSEVDPGDILMPLLRYHEATEEDKAIGKLSKMLVSNYRDASLKWNHDYKGKVVRVKHNGNTVIIQVKAALPAQIGDKLAGRYGNKGVITAIIPDDEMPVTKDGRRVDAFITPLSVQGRINTGQVLETTAGRVAQKRGRPIKINNFDPRFKSDEEIKKLAEKHGLAPTEHLYDPHTGRDLGNISMGPEYMLKLKYMVDKKMTSRGPRASYNADLQPTKGGPTSARALDRLTWNALVAHGARENLREMSTYKSEKNPELWNAVRLGMPLPAPKTPFVVNKMFNLMAAGGINVKKEGNQLQLTPMTDNETLNRSNGEIDDAQVIMAKNLRPVKDGLFDDIKTGGLAGNKWTHITLAEPIVNPVMEKPIKSLLGINGKEFDGLVSGTMAYDPKLKTIVKDTAQPGVLTSGAAFKKMLSGIDIKKEIRRLNDEAMGAKGPALDKINKRLRYLTSLKNLGLSPERAYMMQHLPVLPPRLRPMYPLPDGTIVSSPINFLYRDGIMVNKELKDGAMLPDAMKAKLRKDLYNSVKAIQGLGKPILVRKEKDLKGALETVKGDRPKTGYYQSVVFSKKQELTGTSVISPSVDISPDEILMPKKMAWNMYEPFAMKELINMGYKARDAAQMVANKDDKASIALEKATAKRPVWINRSPSLHKFSILAVQPKLYEGNAIKLHPLIFSGFNADNDGNCVDYDSLLNFRLSKSALDNLDSYMYTEDNKRTKEQIMRTIKESTLTSKHGDKVSINLKIGDFPRIGVPTVDKNGAYVYPVPEGIEVVGCDPITGKAGYYPVVALTVEEECNTVEVHVGGKSVIVSDNESMAVFDHETGALSKMAPKDVGKRMIPMLKKDPAPFGGMGDRDLGWLLGAYISDGWSSGGRTIGYTKLEENKRLEFVRIMRKLHPNFTVNEYEGKPKKGTNKLGNSTKIHLNSKSLAQYMSQYKCLNDTHVEGRASLRKQIPQSVLQNGTEEMLYGLLSGLLDGDGSFVRNTSTKNVRYSAKYSTSSTFLRDSFLALCYRLGIRCSVMTSPPRGYSKEAYTLMLSTVDMYTILDKLTCIGKRECEIITDWKKSPPAKDDLDMIPISVAECAALKKRVNSVIDGSLYSVLSRTKKIGFRASRKILNRHLDILEEHVPSLYKRVIETNTVWRTISSIKDAGKREVFDLAVADAKVFAVNNGLIIWDTMGMYVPISQAAVDEARKFTPTKVLESPRDGGIMLMPGKDIQLGLFVVTAKGKPKAKTYSTIDAAEKDFYRNNIDITDVVTIGGKKTTLGRAMVRKILPSDVVLPNEGVTKANLSSFMKELVSKHRKDFNEITSKLFRIVSKFGYQAGISLTLDDLKVDNKVVGPIKKEIKSKFSKIKTKQGKINFLVKVNDKLDAENKKWVKDNQWKNNLALTAVASGNPKIASLKQLKFMPLILKNSDGQPVPVPITRSYANGLTPSDYWAASYGARSGMIDRALQTSEPGYFAKQLLSVVGKEVISKEDCGTKNGVVLDIKDEPKASFLWRYEAGSNRLIDDAYYNQLKSRGKPVKVRSPLTCECAEGVCAMCYGNHEDGSKSQVGDNVGMTNGQAITERGTQLTMRTFHTGSVVESGNNYATSGMTRLKQLTNLPQFISGKAALSTVDGKVKSITPNPAGGVNIVVRSKDGDDINHFGVINKAEVSVGQKVKAGDKLTAGTIQPKELLNLTGVRNTQDHLVKELNKAYASQGVDINRRSFETVVRGTTNSTKILKPAEGSDYLPGDKAALTKVLAWNRANPSNPIVHKPILLGMDFAAKIGQDWLGKLNTTRLLQTLQEGTAAGEKSDIHSYSPVTPYVIGTSFGKGPNGKY